MNRTNNGATEKYQRGLHVNLIRDFIGLESIVGSKISFICHYKVRSDNCPNLIPAFPRSSCHPEKVYIITGGLGGFGLELAQWLVNRGARHLILTSRSGLSNNYQVCMMEYLKYRGAEVVVTTKNICDRTEVRQLFEDINGRAVGGVFHLAVVGFIMFIGPDKIQTR